MTERLDDPGEDVVRFEVGFRWYFWRNAAGAPCVSCRPRSRPAASAGEARRSWRSTETIGSSSYRAAGRLCRSCGPRRRGATGEAARPIATSGGRPRSDDRGAETGKAEREPMARQTKTQASRRTPQGIEFGRALREERVRSNFAGHAVARRLGVSTGCYFKWEGGRMPGEESLTLLAVVFPGLAEAVAAARAGSGTAPPGPRPPRRSSVARASAKVFGRALRRARMGLPEGSDHTATRAGMRRRRYVQIEQGLVRPTADEEAALRGLFSGLPPLSAWAATGPDHELAADAVGAADAAPEAAPLPPAPPAQADATPRPGPAPYSTRYARSAFASALRRSRVEAGLTPAELADRAGLDLSSIYKWERGSQLPGLAGRSGLVRAMPAFAATIDRLPPARLQVERRTSGAVPPTTGAPRAHTQAPVAGPPPAGPPPVGPPLGHAPASPAPAAESVDIRDWLRTAGEVRRSPARGGVLALLEFAKGAGLGLDDVIEAVRS